MRRHKGPARWKWTLLQSAGVGLIVAAMVALGLVVTAGAGASTACSAIGDQCLGAAAATGTFTAGTPFSSGQVINLSVPANAQFTGSHAAIDVVECAAPSGVIPTNTAACDGNTIQGPSVVPAANGSFSVTGGYTVYALPDSISLAEGSGGPVCGNTLATECIIYMGTNYNDFTQPHFWSQAFFVSPTSDDKGENPGDGTAPVVASVPDKTNSTVAASASTVPADGVNSSTVTVTLKDASNTPVSGKTVTLTPACNPTPCSSAKITGPSPATTDTNGQTTFTIADTAAQSVTLTAADPSDTVTVTQTASVTFQTPAMSAANSSVTANPTNPPADGTTTTTITVTLRDQGLIPQPIAGDSVTLADGSGHAVITPPATSPVTANAQGVATFTATDTTVETVTFTATDTTTHTAITNTAVVTFGVLSVSPAQSTVTATTPAPVGSTGVQVFVTLLSSSKSPVAGKVVSLQASPATTAVVGQPSPSSATSGANGQVSFVVTDSVAETVTLTATDTTDGTTLTQTATVTFESPSPSATTSTVQAQAMKAPADGETQTLIKVNINDQFGQGVSGQNVTMQGSPGGNVEVHPVVVGGVGTPGVTNSSGEADFNADDTKAETVTFTAIDTSDGTPGLTLTQTVTITFTPGQADVNAATSTLTASNPNPPADGTTSTITVTLTDFFGNPVSGTTISLTALNGKSTITPPANPVTDQNGQVTFAVADTTAEVVTYQATDTTDSTPGNPAVFAAEAVVKFGNPPAPPPVAADCSVAASPTSVPANGTSTATVSVLLYDGNGAPVTGKTVTLAAAGGNSKVSATNATTNNSGMATFAVSDTTAESVKYTATDTTDNVALSAIPVTVTFTAAAAGSTTTTTTSPSGATTTTTATNAAAAGTTSPGSSANGATGNTGTGSGSPTLAATGASALLPWLVGLGLLFLVIGTIGRRRFKWHAPINREPNET